jgi:hypothetical protein
MARDYKEIVTQAEKAVASVSDPLLKQTAFQRVLDALLDAEGHGEGARKPKSATRNTASKSNKKRSAGGPMAYVQELVEDSFFKNKKTAADVMTELANRAHHISGSDCAVTLLRLCKAKRLRRQKEGKAYIYSNW